MMQDSSSKRAKKQEGTRAAASFIGEIQELPRPERFTSDERPDSQLLMFDSKWEQVTIPSSAAVWKSLRDRAQEDVKTVVENDTTAVTISLHRIDVRILKVLIPHLPPEAICRIPSSSFKELHPSEFVPLTASSLLALPQAIFTDKLDHEMPDKDFNRLPERVMLRFPSVADRLLRAPQHIKEKFLDPEGEFYQALKDITRANIQNRRGHLRSTLPEEELGNVGPGQLQPSRPEQESKRHFSFKTMVEGLQKAFHVGDHPTEGSE